METEIVLLIFCGIFLKFTKSYDYSTINLPPSHLSYYFNNFQNIKEECLKDDKCMYHNFLQSISDDPEKTKKCWGYEKNCDINYKFSTPYCPSDHNGWVQSKNAQIDAFYYQTDFGYVKQQIEEMSVMCEPTYQDDSSLECSSNLRFCRGTNIFFNFTDLENIQKPFRYDMNVLKSGQIGGHCILHKERLLNETEHMGALQSWAPELRFFEKIKKPLNTRNFEICDEVIDKPTFIMKVDAYSNLYHHFCDFFNLYASLHINTTHPSTFSRNVHILIWETYTYNSQFAETFKAFTNYPIWDLKVFQGKTVCFKNIVLPLLPRMIFGLYYNTPIIAGCEKSGLFKAFSEFMLHRLQIPLHHITDISNFLTPKLRITFLKRHTKFRRVLNEDAILNEIRQNDNYQINVVSFEKGMKFYDQLEVIRNTDILIGMHGAGLTHLLFLPDWSTIFELYNCEDPTCYKDLARLRGVNYITWENEDKVYAEDMGHHPDGGAHAKFTNYKFDVEEFARLVNKSAKHVYNQESYKHFLSESEILNKHDEL